MSDLFAVVDLDPVLVFVAATGITIVSVAMAFKGIILVKRAITKV